MSRALSVEWAFIFSPQPVSISYGLLPLSAIMVKTRLRRRHSCPYCVCLTSEGGQIDPGQELAKETKDGSDSVKTGRGCEQVGYQRRGYKEGEGEDEEEDKGEDEEKEGEDDEEEDEDEDDGDDDDDLSDFISRDGEDSDSDESYIDPQRAKEPDTPESSSSCTDNDGDWDASHSDSEDSLDNRDLRDAISQQLVLRSGSIPRE